MTHEGFALFTKAFHEPCRPQRIFFGSQFSGDQIADSFAGLRREHHAGPISAIDKKAGDFRDGADQRLIVGRVNIETGRGIHIRLFNGFFYFFKKRCHALYLVQSDGRKLPVCIYFFSWFADWLVGINPTDNYTPGFRAPVRVVIDIHSKRGVLGNGHRSFKIDLLPTNRLQYQNYRYSSG